MIQDPTQRDCIQRCIASAIADPRKGAGHLFASDKGGWMAKGERCVGVVGTFASLAIQCGDRILYFGATGLLVHEEPAVRSLAWFEAQFERAQFGAVQ